MTIEEDFACILSEILADDLNTLKSVAVAISGGSDSVALLILLRKFLENFNIKIVGLTVDHDLRAESKQEAFQVADIMKSFNIEHHILKWEHKKINSNIQSQAREARYDLLLGFCQKNKIKHLFIAHHYDDQSETVLMNIFRGTGIDGLAGMHKIRESRGVKILRPLLSFTKDRLKDYLSAKKMPYISDPSNDSDNFTRVKIRRFLNSDAVPKDLIQKLNLLSSNAGRAKRFLEKTTKESFNSICMFGRYGEIKVYTNDLQVLDKEILGRIINLIFRKLHNKFLYPVRFNSLSKIINLIKSNKPIHTTLACCEILRIGHVMYFFKESKYIEAEKELYLGYNVWDSRFIINVQHTGLKIRVLTKEIWRKIKPKDYIKSVPHSILMTTPVILDSNGECVYHLLMTPEQSKQHGSIVYIKNYNFVP